MFVLSLRSAPTVNDENSIGGMMTAILRRIAEEPQCAEIIERQIVESGQGSRPMFWYVLDLLARGDFLEVALHADGRCLLVVSGALPMLLPREERRQLMLSRFASIRRIESSLVLETPFSHTSLKLMSDEAATICSRLAGGASPKELGALLPHLDYLVIQEIIKAFEAVKALEESKTVEPEDSLTQWEHHDLLFHARTRGRMGGFRGGTYRFLGKRPPTSAIPKRLFGPSIHLKKAAKSSQLADLEIVLSNRRSIRSYGKPITSDLLGTFLQQVGRTNAILPEEPDEGRFYDTAIGPYPSGGACHELELYPIINRCTGLSPGAYWYDGVFDRLSFIQASDSASERLLTRASHSMGIHPNKPDILICIAARFGRVNWKYEGISYATVLKDVGVLLQTMYLVATAMGLAPCAIGAGESQDFVEITKIHHFEEDAVGEFALGSSPWEANPN
jgi:SagB-type dehydrogenase family enzyme